MEHLKLEAIGTDITKITAAQLPLAQVVSLLDMKSPIIDDIVYSDKRWEEMEVVDASEIFGSYIPKGLMKLPRFKNRHPKCLASNSNYIPQKDVLMRVLAWWCSPERKLSLFMYGETGTGKTEMLLWFADCMNWPVSLVQVNESLRPEKLQGSYILHEGKTPFRYGSVASAMKYGWCLILDECDKGSSDLLSKLHMPVEYKPWQLDDTGEIIEPHKNFRLCATGNTNGGGDMSGRYQSSQRLDEAFRRRFGFIHCDYPEALIEDKILSSMYPTIPNSVRFNMVKLAVDMRKALTADQKEADATTPEELSKLELPDERMSCAFSTRVLVGWGYYMTTFGLERGTLRDSFDFVFGNSLDDEDRLAVYSIFQRVFGDINQTPAGAHKSK